LLNILRSETTTTAKTATTKTLTCYLIFRQSIFRLHANKNTALEAELFADALLTLIKTRKDLIYIAAVHLHPRYVSRSAAVVSGVDTAAIWRLNVTTAKSYISSLQ
jgi:hypothetical protein